MAGSKLAGKNYAYTLAEIIIVMLIIAVIVAVSVRITKMKLDNIVTYTYYSAYSTLRNISRNMISDFKPDDETYMTTYNILDNYKLANNIFSGLTVLFESKAFGGRYYEDGPDDIYADQISNDCNGNDGYYICGYSYMYIPGEGGRAISSNFEDGVLYDGDEPPKSKAVYGLPKNFSSICTSMPLHEYFFSLYPDYVSGGTYGGAGINDTLYSSECPGHYKGLSTYAYPGKSVEEGCIYPCNSYPETNDCGYYSGIGAYGRPLFGDDLIDTIYSYHFRMEYPSRFVSGSKYNHGAVYVACHPRDNGEDPNPGVTPDPEPTPEPDPDPSPVPEEPELPACNVPDALSQQEAYCAHGYQNYDSTPGVCDYSIKPTKWPPECNKGYRWNNDPTDCKCVLEPRTLPRNGENFCNMFAGYVNTKGNGAECSGDVISSNTTDFSEKVPDLILRNGMRLYNVHQDPQEIAELAGNNEGPGYDGVENVNTHGYTVYVDIDGENSNSILWEDVYPFYITMSGTVIPVYDHSHPGLSGGDSRNHLMVSVENETIGGDGHRHTYWLKKSVSFKEGACTTGYVSSSTPYCSGVPVDLSCAGANGYSCNLKHIKPVKFLF